MSNEAKKLALEALEAERDNYQDWDKEDGAPEYIYEAITALREALTSEAKEQPAQQKPLTDEEILNFGPGQPDAVWSYEDQLYFARAIEAKLKEKNT